MFIVGLTGGIASGKSYVTNLIKQQKSSVTHVIDADEVAKELLSGHYFPNSHISSDQKNKATIKTTIEKSSLTKSRALEQIALSFGDEIINDDGTLNRPMLRELVFSPIDIVNQKTLKQLNKDNKQGSKNNKQMLDAIMHPLVYSEIQRQLDDIESRNASSLVIVSIPLLVESADLTLFNEIWVVDCSIELQLQRALKRDHSSSPIIKEMINAQATREQRLSFADKVISNEGTLSQLEEQVIRLYRQTLSS